MSLSIIPYIVIGTAFWTNS